MRISDLMVTNNYLGHFNSIKDRIAKLNQQILTGQKNFKTLGLSHWYFKTFENF